MYDFPTNPPVGTVVTLPDMTFRLWDGIKWRAVAGSPGSFPLTPITNEYEVTAAGADQATARVVSSNYVRVVAGNWGAGIRVEPLPPLHCRVVNSAGVPIMVYPALGCNFSDMPTDVGFEMQDTQGGFFVRAPGSNEITVSA